MDPATAGALSPGDWYQPLFATRLSPQRQAVPEFDTTAQGCRLATAVRGVLTGCGADLIIIDYPLKPQPASLSLYWADQLDFWAGPASRSLDRARRAPSGSCAMTVRYARAG